MRPGKRIALLVDDDEPSLRTYERVLSKHDVEILSASTPSEALGFVSQLEPVPQPLVAFVDVLMPGMDGPRFVYAIRSFPATCKSPIVLISALSAPALEKATLEWGANGFILKSKGLIHVDQEFTGWLDRVSV